jgi:hypothetical protein
MQAVIIKDIKAIDLIKYILFNKEPEDKQPTELNEEEIKDWKKVTIKWE